MMKWMFASATLLLTGCAQDILNTKPEVSGLKTVPQTQTVIEPESGIMKLLRPGYGMVVELQSNPTTGYSWQVVSGDEAVISLANDTYIADPAPEGVVGSGGHQVLEFSANGAGKTDLILSYQRGSGDVAETRTIIVKVAE